VPELLPEIQVEGDHRPGSGGRPHRLDDELARRGGKGCENPAAVEPAHPSYEDGVPVEVPGLELRGRLVRPVVEHDRGANAVAVVAVDGGHVRACDAVVGEELV